MRCCICGATSPGRRPPTDPRSAGAAGQARPREAPLLASGALDPFLFRNSKPWLGAGVKPPARPHSGRVPLDDPCIGPNGRDSDGPPGDRPGLTLRPRSGGIARNGSLGGATGRPAKPLDSKVMGGPGLTDPGGPNPGLPPYPRRPRRYARPSLRSGEGALLPALRQARAHPDGGPPVRQRRHPASPGHTEGKAGRWRRERALRHSQAGGRTTRKPRLRRRKRRCAAAAE